MNETMLEKLASFGNAIIAAQSATECTQLLRPFLHACDIDTFACGEIDTAMKQRTVFFVIDWPESWRKFYVSSGLVQRDPIIDALARYRGPFTWTELRNERSLPKVGANALRLAAEHGWQDGLVVPLPRGGTRYGLISFAARTNQLSRSAKGILSLVSVAYHEQVRRLAPSSGFAQPPAGLTPREIECLSLVASGLVDTEIAKRLGISRTTAHGHVENARSKLATGTRAGAVNVAISLGIISG